MEQLSTGDLGKADSGLEQRVYYLRDGNFNVTALAGDGGSVVERYVYDPYGAVTIYDGTWTNTRSSSQYDNHVLFCGYRLDGDTGLYHVRFRAYHPSLGRWLQRDPVGYLRVMNLFEYVSSRPCVAVDPLGLDECEEDDCEIIPRRIASLYAYDWKLTATQGGDIGIAGSDFNFGRVLEEFAKELAEGLVPVLKIAEQFAELSTSNNWIYPQIRFGAKVLYSQRNCECKEYKGWWIFKWCCKWGWGSAYLTSRHVRTDWYGSPSAFPDEQVLINRTQGDTSALADWLANEYTRDAIADALSHLYDRAERAARAGIWQKLAEDTGCKIVTEFK